MAFLIGETFDNCTKANLAEKSWSCYLYSDIKTVGRNGTKGFSVDSVTLSTTPALGNKATLIAGTAFKAVGPSAHNYAFLALMDGSSLQVELRLDAAGQRVGIYRNASLLELSSFVIAAGVYYHVQLKATINSSGSWVVKLNNVQILAGSGNTKATANAYANKVGIASVSPAETYFDDLWVVDTSGATCNDFLGDIRGMTQFPNADGTYTDFTASTGDRHDCVNKVTPTADAKYVKSLTPGHKGTFSFPALGVTGTVKAVVTDVYANKSDAGSRVIKPISKSGASAGAGANFSLSDSGIYIPQFVEEVDPATTAAWLVAGVDAAEQGVELVS